MFFAIKLQPSEVYVSFDPQSLFGPSKLLIRGRKIVLRDENVTFDDLREAVTTLEDTARRTRRVFGGAHPLTSSIEEDLKRARVIVVLHVATPSGSAV